jgi:flavin-binding protein dodecin
MSKTYMIWWHSKFVDEISRDTTTIEDIIDKAGKTLDSLEKLRILENQGKIKVKVTGTLNPFYIEVLDDSVEEDVKSNPLVESAD